MSRTAKEANAKIFTRLSAYAANHDVLIPTGERRVFLAEHDYGLLIDSRLIAHFPIGRNQAAILLETSERNILAVAGFEAEAVRPSVYISELEISPGIAVAALADLAVDPTGSPLAVLDVVAAGKVGDIDYEGHDLLRVQTLFPRLRAFEIDAEAGGSDKFFANLLTICAAESVGGNGWITPSLAEELVWLAEQRISGFHMNFSSWQPWSLTRETYSLRCTGALRQLMHSLERPN
ncbi:hypothetical protein [Allobranchiibius sp. GilTou38]|uniref:hypothetical protein n=1 Tax=Allobranchiibius sp. GilTou38 TaxID=2815210 RepID=UPI001AA16D85|nr:hypothetical protein [Allobranchiibius sp. GilTou38]MBO1766113.1 hypothetical protein [Allobranchiibius sp. GilTou38]